MGNTAPPPGSSAVYTTQQLPGIEYKNLGQEIISITGDKARLYLNDWRQKVEHGADITGRVSLCCTLILTLLTADFKDKLILSKEALTHVFWGITFISLWVLMHTLRKRLFVHIETTDEIVERFKNMPETATPAFATRLQTFFGKH